VKRFTIYATDGHCAVGISNGATRETSGADFPAVVAAMHPDDRITLAQFCAGILAALQTDVPRVTGGAK
jgi:hypothetical protein